MEWVPVIPFIVIGYSIIVRMKFPPEKLPAPGWLVLSFWLGVVSVSFIVTFLAVLSGRFFLELYWILAVVGIAFLFIDRKKIPEYMRFNEFLKGVKDKKRVLIWLPLLVLIIIQIILVVSLTVSFPLIGFDSIGNFGMKGKLWYYTRSLFPEQLLNPDFLIYKRTYPAIIPLTEAIWSILGGWHDEHIKIFFVVCWLALGFMIFSILMSRGNRIHSWIAMTFWIVLPYNLYELGGGATNGFGEIPFALALLIALWMMVEFHSTQRIGMIVLLGVLIAATFWVKKEGLPFAFGAFLFLAWKRMKIKYLLLIGAICLSMFFVHLLTTRGLPTYFEGKDLSLAHSFQDMQERFHHFFGFAYEELSRPRHWGELFWLVILGIWIYKLIFRKLRDIVSVELLFFGYMLCIYIIVCHLNVLDFYKVMTTTFDRLFIHLYPLLLLATFHGIERSESGTMGVA